MTVVPFVTQDSAQLETGVAKSRLQADANAFGAQQAHGIAVVGQGFQSVAEAAQHIDQRLDEANVRELDNEYSDYERQALYDPDNGYLNLQGRNALDARQDLTQSIDSQIQTLASQARSPRARQAFEAMASERRNNTFARADQHANSQFRVYEDGLSQARIDGAVRSAGDAPFDDAEIGRQLGIVVSETQALEQRKGLSPEQAQESILEQRDNVAHSVVALRIDRDPAGTLRQLRAEERSGVYTDLSSASRSRLEDAAQTEIRRRESEYRANVRERAGAIVDSLELGVDPGNRLSVDTVRSALGDAGAARYSMALQTYDLSSTMHGHTDQDLNALALRPTPREGTTEERLASAAESGAARQVLAMRQDPATYAARRGLIHDEDEMSQAIAQVDFGAIGARLRSRSAIVTEQAQQLGTQALPLTGTEAAALRNILDSLDANSRVAALRSLQSSVGIRGQNAGSAYGSVLRQVYADDPASFAGAAAISRRGGAAGLSSETISRRILAGSALLNPSAPETRNADGETRQGRSPHSTFSMPSDAVMEGAFQTYVGDAYAGQPQRREQAFQAFRSYFAGEAAETGVNAASLTFRDGAVSGDPGATDLAERAARATVGEMRDNRHTGEGLPAQTYLPWGMTEDDFNNSLRAGWATVQAAHPGAELGSDPSRLDYAPAGNGGYRVFRNGVVVRDNRGRDVIVTPGR